MKKKMYAFKSVALLTYFSLIFFLSICIYGCKESGTSLPNTSETNELIKTIQSDTGILLPASVNNVEYLEISFMTQIIYIRFDIPIEDLKEFLNKSDICPDYDELKIDQNLIREIQIYGEGVITEKNLNWWKMDELKQPICATKDDYVMGKNRTKISPTVSICTGKITDTKMLVYILYTLD